MKNPEQNVTIFLFAHQDDEMAVCHEIEATLRSGGRAICIYLTNGAWGKVTPQVRDAESRYVLGKLGVDPHDIHFTGNATGIASGQLSSNALTASVYLTALLDQYNVGRLISHSWEGGHEDHDAAHWICAYQAFNRGLEQHTWHFNLYRSNPHFWPLYRVLAQGADGTVRSVAKIARRDRLRYLALMLQYRSQAKAIIGLWPFFALHYMLRGTQELHTLDTARLNTRPHLGKLLYEARGRANFETVAGSLNSQLPGPWTPS